MLTNTDNYKQLILQIITKKVLFKIIYTLIVTEFYKQIIKLQKNNLFLSKI